VTATPVAPASTTLPRPIADFVIELSIALHKHAIYPGGHPSVAVAEERVVGRLHALLEERPSLAIGIARDQLIVDGTATDPRNSLLRGLAQHLHRHQLGAVKFLAGVGREEIADVLRTLAIDTERSGGALGLHGSADLPRWSHVQLFPLRYDELLLAADAGSAPAAAETVPRTERLWLELAQAALQSDSAGDRQSPPEPSRVAEGINAHTRDVAYDQVIVGYLLKIAEELRTADEAGVAVLRSRISRLVRGLEAGTLRQLLEMGGDFGQRRKFVLDASHGMAVDAVVTLVEAAADVSKQVISRSLMRLLSKLAVHAEQGSDAARREADAALRSHVQQLVTGWALLDPVPQSYGVVLERMSRTAPLFAVPSESTHACEAQRVIQMSLELGTVGASVREAVEAMIERGEFGVLLGLLDGAPAGSEACEAINAWSSTPENLRRFLETRTIEVERLESLVLRMGSAAVDPLLDTLAASQSRATRRKVLDLLVRLGPEIGPAIVARLPGSPWFFQRNLLNLLDRMPSWPQDFTPSDYLTHADPRVRREATRLLLRRPATRDDALCVVLKDSDEQLVRLALTTALENCPERALPTIIDLVSGRTLDADLHLLALRVVASAKSPAALQCLIDCALGSRRWFRRRRLATKSPQLIVALAGLAAHWSGDSRVVPVLTLAARHDDPDVRAAVAVRKGAP
jgi:hypothetical protein